MAALLKHELGLDAELIEGGRGEFTVWVGEKMVAEKGWIRFPADAVIMKAVRDALDSQ